MTSTYQLPEDLQRYLTQFESMFYVSKDALDKIIEHFISELQRGLNDGTDPSGIPMNIAWVMDYPTGEETGDYLALDLGGTNLRVVAVHLEGNHKFTTEQKKYRLSDNIRITPDRDELFGFISDCIAEFLKEKNPEGIPEGTVYPLGFTFSYPCTQTSIDSGILQRWTKGFDIPNVEGHDVVELLNAHLAKSKVPVKIVACINDTCGTLCASRYTDPLAEMGCIFGTGVNGCYYERVGDIKKLAGKLPTDLDDDTLMLVNCEYGSFDNAHKILPRTVFDEEIDAESPRPGQQAYEKMTSGYYLGDLIRKAMLKGYKDGILFKNLPADSEGAKKLQTGYILDTSFLSALEADQSATLADTEKEFLSKLSIETTLDERYVAKKLAIAIGTRAARLSTAGISAACKKRGYKRCDIAADGSVYMKYPHFPERAAAALAETWGWGDMPIEDHPIKIVAAQDGSGVGAAVIAALTHIRSQKGKSLGMTRTASQQVIAQL